MLVSKEVSEYNKLPSAVEQLNIILLKKYYTLVLL